MVGSFAQNPSLASPWPAQITALGLAEQPATIFHIQNSGEGGARLDEQGFPNTAAYVDAYYSEDYYENIVVLFFSNDIGGGDSESFWNDIVTWCSTQRTFGWKTILMTLPTRVSADPEWAGWDYWNTARLDLNSHMRAGWATIADALADIALEPLIGGDDAPWDTDYFYDGVHMTPLCNSLVAPIVRDAIDDIVS